MKKVSELEGAELDFWVARALGWEHLGAIGVNYENKEKPYCLSSRNDWWRHQEHQPYPMCGPCHGFPYPFSKDWEVGGPIIEREGICLVANATHWPKTHVYGWRAGYDIEARDGHVYSEHTSDPATIELRHEQEGKTALIAAMRCFVASKFGDEVD